MTGDALALGLLAAADLALILHLRGLYGRRARMERMMASLRVAVRRETDVEALPPGAGDSASESA